MKESATIRSFRNDFGQHARVQAGRIAIIDAAHDREFSYAACASLIARYGAFFKAQGLKPGDVILAVLPNSVETLILFMAAAQHGLGFAPISMDSQSREIARWIGTVRPAIAFVTDTTVDICKAAITNPTLPVITINVDGTFDWLPADEAWASLSGGGAGRLLLTTSGSTGDPKAMVIDTDVLWSAGCAFVGQHQFVDADSRFFNILPMSYLGGLFNLGLIPLAAGGSLVVTEPFSGRSFLDFWQNVERFEVSVLWLVPTIVRGLLALAERTHRNTVSRPNKSVRACFLGTAPIDLASKTKFEETFEIPLLENFALSETTFFTSETLGSRAQRVERSVGEPLPYVELAFRAVSRDDADSGAVPTEIMVRTPFLFVGYLQPDGRIERNTEENGFFATGDLGRLDQAGRLIIEGRNRDIIKKGGYFIALREIEQLAIGHAAVEEAAAVGVPHSFYGEDLVLCLRFKDGVPPDTQEFGQWLRQNLVKHKWPERIVAIDDFPRTASGKIRKHLIKI